MQLCCMYHYHEPAMTLNAKQREVFDACVSGDGHIFCTGEGGTGKSWLISEIVSELRNSASPNLKTVAVTASTGLAAFNVHGSTLHAFSGVQIIEDNVTEMITRARRHSFAEWTTTDILIIDEISMVSAVLFDNLSIVAQNIRGSAEPFGGMRIIMFGDFLQLSPISKNGVKAKKVFMGNAWKAMKPKCFTLTDIIRQSDAKFRSILSAIRLGRCGTSVEQYISSLSRKVDYKDNIKPVKLFSLRVDVDTYNNSMLSMLRSVEYTFDATDKGNIGLLKQCLAPKQLTLKVGAQVMIIRNMSPTIVNGTLGTITGFDFDDDTMSMMPKVTVVNTNGVCEIISVVRSSWDSVSANGMKVLAKRIQLPIILAWATTIHKSQGMTIPRLSVDLHGIFDEGQVYVALSRAVSASCLQVSNFTRDKIKADMSSVRFYASMNNPQTSDRQITTGGKTFIGFIE